MLNSTKGVILKFSMSGVDRGFPVSYTGVVHNVCLILWCSYETKITFVYMVSNSAKFQLTFTLYQARSGV